MSGEDGEDDWYRMLSPRLFATDIYSNGKLNIYSKLEILLQTRDLVIGSKEFDQTMRSAFGKLWNLHFTKCPISCKLIHTLLARQLVTPKKYEMWTVFGGQPLRFSLVEFENLIGLEWSEFLQRDKGHYPFVLQRDKDHYKNVRSGDYGPFAVKLMKMHASGVYNDGSTVITDRAVDELRKDYVMEIYKEVVPPCTSPSFFSTIVSF